MTKSSPTRGVTGGTLPAQIWRDAMLAAEKGLPLQGAATVRRRSRRSAGGRVGVGRIRAAGMLDDDEAATAMARAEPPPRRAARPRRQRRHRGGMLGWLFGDDDDDEAAAPPPPPPAQLRVTARAHA